MREEPTWLLLTSWLLGKGAARGNREPMWLVAAAAEAALGKVWGPN